MADEFNQQDQSLIDRVKESPRTVSALIIILIVAAAVYAFSGKEQATSEDVNTEEPAQTTEAEGEEQADTESTEEATAPTAEVSNAPVTTTVTQEQLETKAKDMPAAAKTDNGYTETVQRGDGTTHLARRAATRWLSENQAGYTVTNEHRVYIEDYIRRRLEGGAKIGEERTVAFDLIAEAVAKAGQLNERQLQNLTRYSGALK